jgi:hypothetical protein
MLTLDINPVNSNYHKSLWFILLGGSLLSTILTDAPLIYKLALVVFSVCYLLPILLNNNKIDRIIVKDHGIWSLYIKDKIYTAELRGDSFSTPLLVILRWSTLANRRVFTRVIFKDSLSFHEFRRLRVKVRMVRKLL